MSYNNIDLMYHRKGDYSKTRPFYKCPVNIGQHSLPSNDPLMQLYRMESKMNKYRVDRFC